MASDRQQRLDQFPSCIRQIRLVASIQHQRVPSGPYDALSLKVDADFQTTSQGRLDRPLIRRFIRGVRWPTIVGQPLFFSRPALLPSDIFGPE
jgi:hypothetical protein